VASTTAHFVIGAALAIPALKWHAFARLRRWTIPLAAGVLAVTPDLDLLTGRVFHVFGLRPQSLFSHRGFFHSPFFLVLLAAVLAAVFARTYPRKTFVWLWLLWTGCMVTHPLLDALTDGGTGVMLALPFTRARFFFPWRPIHTPPYGVDLLSRGWSLRPSEIPFCAAAILIGISGLWVLDQFGRDPLLRKGRPQFFSRS
jgi:inner membrane protein